MPNYSYIFKFEDDFEHIDAKVWFNRYWTACFYYVGVYMLVIFAGQQFMANRPRYELRGPLICWNIMLAAFSIIGTCRTLPEFFHVLRNYGLYHSVCVPRSAIFPFFPQYSISPLPLFSLRLPPSPFFINNSWQVFVLSIPESGLPSPLLPCLSSG